MKTLIRIDAAEFSKSLGMLEKVISNKVALPILKSVLITYDRERKVYILTGFDTENRLTIEATAVRTDEDGNRTVQPFMTMIQDDSRDPFTACCITFAGINGQPGLRDAVGKIPKAGVFTMSIEGTDDGGIVEVSYQVGKFQIPFQTPDEYPQPTVVSTKEQPGAASPLCRFTVDGRKLLPLMKAARCCTANDELRPVMNGECIDVSHDGITVVASDGHTLFKDTLQMGMGTGWMDYGEFPVADPATGQPGSASLLIPRSAIPAIIAVFSAAERLTVTADAQCAVFSADGTTLTVRMIDGRYPNYNSVIPKGANHKVVLGREWLRQALCRLNLFANEISNLAQLRREGDEFIIEARNDEFNCHASERITILESDAFLPDDFAIGFKCSTLISLLDCIDTDNVNMYFESPSTAFLMKPEDVNSTRLLLAMPMLLNA